ncbi:IclR family transcriptional regulator domain-containing protein [Sulfitobacter sp. SK012]|uniref:IclR family transcriptional regulator domain-containing protein n=1 Tax=Sulfitobacter sp. SK012 TaxID=1389005 RepID=UPI0013B37EC0|nr:IclR family transcriptional regulator C-terminal domain-containing protein [Sulfitobacter sp. SK012]
MLRPHVKRYTEGIEMNSGQDEGWYAERDISTTFVKGLKVLAAFDDGYARLTLPEIGKATQLDRAAVRRLVITLVDLGYVEKADKYFSLTPKVLTLAGSYLRGNSVGATVQPTLNRHSQTLGREISVAAIADTSAVYIAQSIVAGSNVSFGFTVGSRLPLLHSAIGRMLLAYAPPDHANSLIEHADLSLYTSESLQDRDAIRDQITAARAHGFAVVSNEFEGGIAGLAVPVGRPDAARMALGISAPVSFMKDPATHETCLSILQLCAKEIYRSLPGGR